jgi:serine/threonine protein kinase
MSKKSQEYNPLNDSFLIENKCIFKKYKPIKRIGKGSFGNIYSIVRLEDKSVFAMKTEKINSQKTLESEAYFLYILQGFGIPKIISFGHTKKYNILIETLLDKSLHTIFFRDKRKCNIENACLIGIQILDRLEWIHSKDIIYRDVKPENFLIGTNDPNIIYIVDFGLCKKYRSSKTGKHVLPKYTGRFNGTLLYASQYAVRGKEASRRDDIISLGYMLIYLIKRRLPWKKDFKSLTKQQYREMLQSKESNGNGELFREIPQEFIDYVEYAKKLKFEEEPDYPRLRCLFFNLLERMKINYRTLTFSWINDSEKQNNLSCIPRNNSQRKKSPFVKILKNIQERKKMSESNKNLKMNNISIIEKENVSCEKQNDVRTEIIKKNKTKRINISPLKLKSLAKNKNSIKNINMIPIYDKTIRKKNHSNFIGNSENNFNITNNKIINDNFAKSNINYNVNENIINDKDDNCLINMKFDLDKKGIIFLNIKKE